VPGSPPTADARTPGALPSYGPPASPSPATSRQPAPHAAVARVGLGGSARVRVRLAAVAAVRRAWSEHRDLILLVVVFRLGSLVAGPLLGGRPTVGIADYLPVAVMVLAGVVPLVLLLETFGERIAHERRLARKIPTLRGWRIAGRRTARQLSLERAVGLAIVVLCAAVSFTTLNQWRTSIPAVHPFAFDERLASLDRALHLGVDPWRVTHAALGGIGTSVVELVYSAGWGLGNALLVAAAAIAPWSHWRRRVLCAYALMHVVLGTIVALVVSSAGPVYAPDLPSAAATTHGFDVLRELLWGRHSPIPLTAHLQQQLWLDYVHGSGFGISAFPSLHVASAALVALALRARGGWAFAAAIAFVVVIQVGSVHLGWHYAVDGYASIGAMIALWWVAGRLAQRPTIGGAAA